MKIAFVLDDSLDKADGVQQYVLTLGRWLTSQNHQVHYLVGQTRRRDIPRVHSLSKNISVHFNQNRMSTPLPVKKMALQKLMETQKFDVVHVQLPYSPFLAGRIISAAQSDSAVVGTFHIIPFSKLESVAARALWVVSRRGLKRLDTIYSVSPPAQKFAKKAFRIKSTVLPNVISLSHYQSARPIKKYQDDKLNIVFLGRLVERKGCLQLLRALKELNDKRELTRVRVLIAGKGPLKPKLEKFVADNHLKSVVKFVGFVSEDDKPDLLASADIAIFPSLGGESFGIVLIEAMASGAGAVLAGKNSGYKSVMKPRPNQQFDATDVSSIARILRHYLNNQRARKSARHWQDEYVKQFDVRVVGKELVNDYRAIIAKRAQKTHN